MLSTPKFDQLHKYDLWINGVFLLGSTFALTTAYFLAFYPVYMQQSTAQLETEQLQDLIHQTSELNEKHHQLTTQLATAEQVAAELARRIPAAPRESDFLSQFCELAERTGMEVADYHPGVIDQREDHQEMEVQIKTSGEYESLGKLLHEIDRMPRLCRLTQLNLGIEAKGTKLQAEMLFRIYFAQPAANDAKKG